MTATAKALPNPPVPENHPQDRTDARQLFSALKRLCRFDGDEAAFWKEYAFYTAELCRSPLTLALSVGDETWKAVHFHCSVDIDEAARDALIRQTLTLHTRMKDRDFAFEPLRVRGFAMPAPFLLAFRIDSADDASSTVVSVVTDHSDQERFNDIVVRTQLVGHVHAAWRQYTVQRRQLAGPSDIRLLYALELLDDVIAQKKFGLACMTLVNELATRFGFSLASMGWKKGDHIKTRAVSHLENFDKNSEAIADVEGLFEEAADGEREIVLPDRGEGGGAVIHRHRLYKSAKDLDQIATIPIYVEGMAAAAVTLERVDGEVGENDLKLISIALNQAGPWLAELHKRDQWMGARLAYAAKHHLAWWLGPENTWRKLFILIFIAALAASWFYKIDFRLESTATLETDNVAYLSAPFHGFVEEVHVHAGDAVSRGQLLVRLDTEELALKELEEEAKVQRFTREAEKAQSSRDLADMKVALARVKQAETELKRIRHYLDQARVVAPFDGIVVDGDKQELQGSPVSKGDMLLKVANPTNLYVKIKLSERDIDDVKSNAPGELKLLSQPNAFHDLTVDTIIPVAQPDAEEGGVFVIKARLKDEPAAWWRPGMSGVAYIHVDRRPVLWILLHRTIDAIRMKLWF